MSTTTTTVGKRTYSVTGDLRIIQGEHSGASLILRVGHPYSDPKRVADLHLSHEDGLALREHLNAKYGPYDLKPLAERMADYAKDLSGVERAPALGEKHWP